MSTTGRSRHSGMPGSKRGSRTPSNTMPSASSLGSTSCPTQAMPDAATGSRKPGAPSEAKGTPVEPRLRPAYPKAFGRTVTLIERICQEAGDADLVQTLRANLRRQGLLKAVRRRDTPLIFEWLVDALSYQGVSNLAAFTYME